MKHVEACLFFWQVCLCHGSTKRQLLGAFLREDLHQEQWSKLIQTMVYQMNQWILAQDGFISSEWLWTTDSDIPKEHSPCLLFGLFSFVSYHEHLEYWLNKNGKKQLMFKCLWAKDVLLQNVQKAHVFAGWGVELVFYVKSFHITWRCCMISNLFVVTTKVSTQG